MEHIISSNFELSTELLKMRTRLVSNHLREYIAGKSFSELFEVTLDNGVQPLVGDVILKALADHGLMPGDVDAVGALTPAAVPLVTSVINAAYLHGDSMDGFIMDFVYPSIKGPSISGKNVVLLDAWLSEKSYVQTSSLVTLRNTNELNLDFGVVEREGAKVLAIASLIGDFGSISSDNENENDFPEADVSQSPSSPSIEVIDPVTGTSEAIPFVQVFSEQELRAEPKS